MIKSNDTQQENIFVCDIFCFYLGFFFCDFKALSMPCQETRKMSSFGNQKKKIQIEKTKYV